MSAAPESGGGGPSLIEDGCSQSFPLYSVMCRLSDEGWPEAQYLRYLSKEFREEKLLWDGLVQNSCAGSIGIDKRTSLMYHSYMGNEQRVRWLLARGARPDGVKTLREGFTAIHYAAQEGHSGVCSLLLWAGGSPSVLSKNGTYVRSPPLRTLSLPSPSPYHTSPSSPHTCSKQSPSIMRLGRAT